MSKHDGAKSGVSPIGSSHIVTETMMYKPDLAEKRAWPTAAEELATAERIAEKPVKGEATRKVVEAARRRVGIGHEH